MAWIVTPSGDIRVAHIAPGLPDASNAPDGLRLTNHWSLEELVSSCRAILIIHTRHVLSHTALMQLICRFVGME
jgi:hypothetical protein